MISPAMSPAMSLADARRALAEAFSAAGLDSPELDARILTGHATGLDTTSLLTQSQRQLTAIEAKALTKLAARRLAREPIARILGEQEFYGITFQLSPACLVPRPDSEVLIETALSLCTQSKGRVLDLGTGPGTLLLAFLHGRPGWTGLGVDLSSEACATATGNAERLKLAERAEFRQGSWTDPVEGAFDCILTNPPYIPSETCDSLDAEVREHDPRLALDGGKDGLDAYRALATRLGPFLARDGILIVEAGIGQAEAIMSLFSAKVFAFQQACKDLGGIERAIVFHKAPSD